MLVSFPFRFAGADNGTGAVLMSRLFYIKKVRIGKSVRLFCITRSADSPRAAKRFALRSAKRLAMKNEENPYARIVRISGGGADDGFGFDIDEAASLHGIVDALEQNGDQPFPHRHFIYVEGSQRRVAHL